MSGLGQKRPWCHVGSNVWFARKETSIDGRQSAIPVIAVIHLTGRYEYWNPDRASVGLSARELDDLSPFLGLVGNELAEVGRRAWKGAGAQIGKPRHEFGFCEYCVDLLVEFVDDLGRRVPGRANAMKGARLVAGHEVGHGRS